MSMEAFLKGEGYIIETASDFLSAREKLQLYKYDGIVLDLNLPGGSGLELLGILKKEKIKGSVVIISANNTLDDKIEGLELGADDYLTKPFHLSELNARVKAVLRRNSYQGSSEITINEIRINPESKMVWINEKVVTLTKKEYLLLEFFIINKNKVLSKESISEHLWGDYMDQSDSFDFIYSHLKNLRKKLVANGAKDYVKTVYGTGYIFNTL
jgi:DNA-binding response OmpR family regulator